MPSKIKSQSSKVKTTHLAGALAKRATQKSKVEKKTIAKPAVKPVRSTGLSAQVFDTNGKVAGSITLSKVIFDAKVNQPLMAQAVRVYLANQRAGSASTKSRGEVQGSTRKIYKQKGTGRARHGGIRAPIFVHGGIAHGPKPHDFSLTMPKKMKQRALFSALTAKLKNGEIKIVTGLEKLAPKTKNMATVLRKLEFFNTKHILLVVPNDSGAISRAARNIPCIEIRLGNSLNTYEVLQNNVLLIAKEALSLMEQTFIKE